MVDGIPNLGPFDFRMEKTPTLSLVAMTDFNDMGSSFSKVASPRL